MKKLFCRGTYNGGKRPSEHQVGDKSFLTNNGGAIPPNVLVPPNSELLPLEVLPIANPMVGSIPPQVQGTRPNVAPGGHAGSAHRVLRAISDG